MKLYLFQHGEATREEVDPERPLTAQGRADVESIALLLEQAGIYVARVVHSGKLRAQQTAEILAGQIAPDLTPEVCHQIKPNDDPVAFEFQRGTPDQDTLVVGHLPFMSRLVSFLVDGDDSRHLVNYSPGSVVCLEANEHNDWAINWLIRPELVNI